MKEEYLILRAIRRPTMTLSTSPRTLPLARLSTTNPHRPLPVRQLLMTRSVSVRRKASLVRINLLTSTLQRCVLRRQTVWHSQLIQSISPSSISLTRNPTSHSCWTPLESSRSQKIQQFFLEVSAVITPRPCPPQSLSPFGSQLPENTAFPPLPFSPLGSQFYQNAPFSPYPPFQGASLQPQLLP